MSRLRVSIAVAIASMLGMSAAGPEMPARAPASGVCRHTIKGRSRRGDETRETCCSCGAKRVNGGPWTGGRS